jgi:hypothetical protein
MIVHIFEIEKAIKEAFKKTVIDYNSNKIFLEEDCRACFYHHMRPFIDIHPELEMLLSHNVEFVENKVIKPDVFIFRNEIYLVAMEFKCDSHSSKYDKKMAVKDRNRLRKFKDVINRAYFVHFDKTDKHFKYDRKDWHNNYFVELYHIKDENKTGCIEVKLNKTKHIAL